LHSEQIVHRDLAARNLLLSADGSIKITDFGLSRILFGDDVSIPNGLVAVAWMAPESLSSARFSSASDMYSFGMVLFELWTRRLPFDDIGHLPTIKDCVLHGQRPVLDAHDSVVLQQLYQQCVDADPSRRITAQRAYEILRSMTVH
jgi:serine/threonine protein kinase